jgi:hypothetical protein
MKSRKRGGTEDFGNIQIQYFNPFVRDKDITTSSFTKAFMITTKYDTYNMGNFWCNSII